MADILVRDVDSKVLARLKAQAKINGRSLQSEAKSILENSARYTMGEFRQVAREWRRKSAGRKQTDSAKLVREDRRR